MQLTRSPWSGEDEAKGKGRGLLRRRNVTPPDRPHHPSTHSLRMNKAALGVRSQGGPTSRETLSDSDQSIARPTDGSLSPLATADKQLYPGLGANLEDRKENKRKMPVSQEDSPWESPGTLPARLQES